MFRLYDSVDCLSEFNTEEELKKYIETRHAEKGGFDWISEITDEKGNSYGCTWSLKIEKL